MVIFAIFYFDQKVNIEQEFHQRCNDCVQAHGWHQQEGQVVHIPFPLLSEDSKGNFDLSSKEMDYFVTC